MNDTNKEDFEKKETTTFGSGDNSLNQDEAQNGFNSNISSDDGEINSEGTGSQSSTISDTEVAGYTSIPANNIYNNQQNTPIGTTGTGNANMYYSQNSNSQGYYYQPANGGTPPTAPPQKRKSKAPLIICCIVAGCFIVGILGMTFGGAINFKNNVDTTEESVSNSEGLDVNSSPTPPTKKGDTDELTTVGVIEKVENSCVGITVTVQNNSNSYGTLGGTTSTGEGSGVLMLEDTAKGITYVVTCAHVIDTANSVFTVTLNDKTTYTGTLVGYDSQTDIGVLSIPATGLSIAEFGESDSLKKGQSVIAIGNPGGSASANASTQGIVSVIDRPVSSAIGYATKCIQHTAPINPGNSGGGLFNMYGQVVGINSSKIASTEYEAMGFAVPTKTMQEVVNDIISTGYVTGRAQLGIQYNKISDYQNYAQLVAAGLPKGAVVIASINETSAFNGTNVQQYDVITAVNDAKLESVDVLTSALSDAKPGDSLKISMARIQNGKIDTFDVTVILVEARG